MSQLTGVSCVVILVILMGVQGVGYQWTKIGA